MNSHVLVGCHGKERNSGHCSDNIFVDGHSQVTNEMLLLCELIGAGKMKRTIELRRIKNNRCLLNSECRRLRTYHEGLAPFYVAYQWAGKAYASNGLGDVAIRLCG
jgi:hypothetical protein